MNNALEKTVNNIISKAILLIESFNPETVSNYGAKTSLLYAQCFQCIRAKQVIFYGSISESNVPCGMTKLESIIYLALQDKPFIIIPPNWINLSGSFIQLESGNYSLAVDDGTENGGKEYSVDELFEIENIQWQQEIFEIKNYLITALKEGRYEELF